MKCLPLYKVKHSIYDIQGNPLYKKSCTLYKNIDALYRKSILYIKDLLYKVCYYLFRGQLMIKRKAIFFQEVIMRLKSFILRTVLCIPSTLLIVGILCVRAKRIQTRCVDGLVPGHLPYQVRFAVTKVLLVAHEVLNILIILIGF